MPSLQTVISISKTGQLQQFPRKSNVGFAFGTRLRHEHKDAPKYDFF
jgi:hypothetical protein